MRFEWTVLRIVVGVVLAWLLLVVWDGPVSDAAPLPPCMFEDGSPTGDPCLWTDPDTGAVYYVASENYR